LAQWRHWIGRQLERIKSKRQFGQTLMSKSSTSRLVKYLQKLARHFIYTLESIHEWMINSPTFNLLISLP
jgi:hypothetical protein